MAKDRTQPLSEINFYCKPCFQSFKAEPGRVEDAPEQEHHPFAYYAPCPKCGAECGQASWEKSLLKAWANATGPKTEAGKAATAANLEGHPTPDEALRTRFNAMKHGMTARTATYFPAKPDGYDFCSGCDVDRVWCAGQPACAKQTELFMLHHAAFEQKNPKHLMGIYADLQSSLFAVIRQILQGERTVFLQRGRRSGRHRAPCSWRLHGAGDRRRRQAEEARLDQQGQAGRL